MGWYTWGPGGFTYKYGNVHALARACRLGECTICPRIFSVLSNGEYFDEPDFLSDIQAAIEKLNLPWSHVDFIQEGLKADPDQDLIDYVTIVKDIVSPYIQSIESYINQLNRFDEPVKIIEIIVRIDFNWTLDKKDWPAFIDWLSIPMTEPLSVEKISKGAIEDTYYLSYSLPVELGDAMKKLDDTRHLGLNALGTAILIDEEVFLGQPYDSNQSRIVLEGERFRIVVE
ncbi:hypothetical protein BKI52_15240 [marine bacterium AO1-C]|nr:hypothetical protein BKI52_15240 [marine bacterium AO1-C]